MTETRHSDTGWPSRARVELMVSPETARLWAYCELRDLIDDLGGSLPPSADWVEAKHTAAISHTAAQIVGACVRLQDAIAQVDTCRQRMLAESSGDAPDVGEVRYG